MAEVSDEENKKKLISNLLRRKFNKKAEQVPVASANANTSSSVINNKREDRGNADGGKGNEATNGVSGSNNAKNTKESKKQDDPVISDEETKKSLIKGLLRKRAEKKNHKSESHKTVMKVNPDFEKKTPRVVDHSVSNQAQRKPEIIVEEKGRKGKAGCANEKRGKEGVGKEKIEKGGIRKEKIGKGEIRKEKLTIRLVSNS